MTHPCNRMVRISAGWTQCGRPASFAHDDVQLCDDHRTERAKKIMSCRWCSGEEGPPMWARPCPGCAETRADLARQDDMDRNHAPYALAEALFGWLG